jgi:hypothetical protein
VKKVPGRKTDVKDAEWIADLLCHGLLRSSFVPPKPIRELRDLTRYRRKLVESRSAERNRLLKLLESANIKLASVASDVFGVSSRLMLQALVEAANAAAKAKSTYLRDKFYRLKARRGYKRAAIAVAHKILVAIYHMFSHRVCYNELGDLYLDKLNKHHLTRNLVHRLERLGYTVTLDQKAA